MHLHSLDLALLQAGAGVKGEFENRLKGLINEVKSSTEKIILFIDEAHTMIGAGGPAGQNDAANLLKPALARGEFRTIAATTWSEYKKSSRKIRRWRGASRWSRWKSRRKTCLHHAARHRGRLEKHHGLRILDERSRPRCAFASLYRRTAVAGQGGQRLDTACARLSARAELHAAADRGHLAA